MVSYVITVMPRKESLQYVTPDQVLISQSKGFPAGEVEEVNGSVLHTHLCFPYLKTDRKRDITNHPHP